MEHIPVVGSIQKGTRQLFAAISGDGPHAFKQVVMVEFRQPNKWMIGFISGEGSLPGAIADKPYTSVFIPSSPLPTTGWLVYIQKEQIQLLDLTVDQGMKIVLSGGVLPPTKKF
ncbi:MAG: DUF502 domain-containing protein [Ghiorsea sp.]